jgi:transcriptional regulatory protein GAL4
LTRSNLTAAEDRVHELETAFTSLFPGIDLDTIICSIRSGNSDISSRKTTKQSAKKSLLNEQDSHDASLALESLPREADGFDWTESAVRLSDLSDGMAALSINPEGAGYLGECNNGLKANESC